MNTPEGTNQRDIDVWIRLDPKVEVDWWMMASAVVMRGRCTWGWDGIAPKKDGSEWKHTRKCATKQDRKRKNRHVRIQANFGDGGRGDRKVSRTRRQTTHAMTSFPPTGGGEGGGNERHVRMLTIGGRTSKDAARKALEEALQGKKDWFRDADQTSQNTSTSSSHEARSGGWFGNAWSKAWLKSTQKRVVRGMAEVWRTTQALLVLAALVLAVALWRPALNKITSAARAVLPKSRSVVPPPQLEGCTAEEDIMRRWGDYEEPVQETSNLAEGKTS